MNCFFMQLLFPSILNYSNFYFLNTIQQTVFSRWIFRIFYAWPLYYLFLVAFLIENNHVAISLHPLWAGVHRHPHPGRSPGESQLATHSLKSEELQRILTKRDLKPNSKGFPLPTDPLTTSQGGIYREEQRSTSAGQHIFTGDIHHTANRRGSPQLGERPTTWKS